MIRGLASTGLVTRFPDVPDHAAIVEWCPRLDVDGLELSIGRVWDAARVEHDLAAAGLRFATAHLDKRIGAELLEDAAAALAQLESDCRLAASLGATLVVLHLWELPVGDRRLAENLALLPACLDVAEAAGVTLDGRDDPVLVGLAARERPPRARHATTAAASRSTPSSSPTTASSTPPSRTTRSGNAWPTSTSRTTAAPSAMRPAHGAT